MQTKYHKGRAKASRRIKRKCRLIERKRRTGTTFVQHGIYRAP